MEIAEELAAARLMDVHQMPFAAFTEPADATDKRAGTCYKEAYQDEFNRYYDEAYARVARLMKFDIGALDGIAKN